MGSESKPMDPERIARLRRFLANDPDDDEDAVHVSAVLAAEVTRLRARVRVEAEDVERAGVTQGQIEAWLRAHDWRNSGRVYPDGTSHWLHGDGGTNVLACTDVPQTVYTFGVLASTHSRPGLDILDEMAAMEVPS